MSRRRKKKKSAAGWIVLLLFVLLILFVSYKYIFIVWSVDVTGTSSVSAEEIKRAANLEYKRPIFLCSEEKIRKGIDALGVIETVSVQKVYPSTVLIEVRQRTPAMYAVHQNDYVTMDEKGYVIRTGKNKPDDLLCFTGVHITDCKQGSLVTVKNGELDAMRAITAAIGDAGGAGYVHEIDIEDLSDIKITAVNKTTVSVGSTEMIEEKMAWMTAAIADLVSRGQEGGTLDVTSGTKADYELPPVIEETII